MFADLFAYSGADFELSQWRCCIGTVLRRQSLNTSFSGLSGVWGAVLLQNRTQRLTGRNTAQAAVSLSIPLSAFRSPLFVGTSSISLAPLTPGLTHSAAPPLPAKSPIIWGPLQGQGAPGLCPGECVRRIAGCDARPPKGGKTHPYGRPKTWKSRRPTCTVGRSPFDIYPAVISILESVESGSMADFSQNGKSENNAEPRGEPTSRNTPHYLNNTGAICKPFNGILAVRRYRPTKPRQAVFCCQGR